MSSVIRAIPWRPDKVPMAAVEVQQAMFQPSGRFCLMSFRQGTFSQQWGPPRATHRHYEGDRAASAPPAISTPPQP